MHQHVGHLLQTNVQCLQFWGQRRSPVNRGDIIKADVFCSFGQACRTLQATSLAFELWSASLSLAGAAESCLYSAAVLLT